MSPKSFIIQFTGTGNAWSKPPINFNTNALIHVDDKIWLLDCGLLCPLALFELGMPQEKISGIYISHLHGDHVLGLEELLFFNYFAHNRKLDLWLPNIMLTHLSHLDGYDIWENCLRASMETWNGDLNRMMKFEDFANIHPMDPDNNYSIFGLDAQLLPTEHAPGHPSAGLILDHRVAYTSDCTFSLKRIENLFNSGIQTIFHEVTFAPPRTGNIHTSFEEIQSIPEEFAKNIYLMHYADKATAEDFDKAIQKGFKIAKRGVKYNF